MVVFNLVEAKEEIMQFLRNNDLISVAMRGVTTTRDMFSGDGTAKDFTFTNSKVKNVRSAAITRPGGTGPPTPPGPPVVSTITKEGSDVAFQDGYYMGVALKPTEDNVTLNSIKMLQFSGGSNINATQGVGRLYQFPDDTFTNAANEFFTEQYFPNPPASVLLGTYNIDLTTLTFTINQAITSNYDYIFTTRINRTGANQMIRNGISANSGNHLNASNDALRIRGTSTQHYQLGGGTDVSLNSDVTYMLDNVIYQQPGTPGMPGQPLPPISTTLKAYDDYTHTDSEIKFTAAVPTGATANVQYDYGNTDRIFPDYAQEHITIDNTPRIAFDVISASSVDASNYADSMDTNYMLQFSVMHKDRLECDKLANNLANLFKGRDNKFERFSKFYYIRYTGMGPMIITPASNNKVAMRVVNCMIWNINETGA